MEFSVLEFRQCILSLYRFRFIKNTSIVVQIQWNAIPVSRSLVADHAKSILWSVYLQNNRSLYKT